MKAYNLARYALWAALLNTANANRRRYHLPTAYLPHGVGNTLTLLFPDLLAAGEKFLTLDKLFAQIPLPTVRALYRTLHQMAIDNPRYVLYVGPAALGYILSHPQFTIYKGQVNDMRIGGFGPDNLVHAITGYAVTRMLTEFLDLWAVNLEDDDPLKPVIEWAQVHKRATTGLFLALLTLIWEGGEYRMQQSELTARGGDATQINMDWSVDDTVHDVISNFVGWFLATQSPSAQTNEWEIRSV